jgi:glycosyltransferase involved in cell wall biosynthesis
MVSEHASPLSALGGVDAGGQNVHVAELSQALARRLVEVVVHTRRDSATLPDRVTQRDGVIVDHVTAGPARPVPKDQLFPFMAEFADQLRRQWREDRPDVVHAHFWMSGWAALAAARPLGVPVVQTFHALGSVKRRQQGDKDTSPGERLRTEQAVLRQADHIVATSTDEVFELCRLGADRRRISVVPCGVDTDVFAPVGPVEPRPRKRHRIVVVSRLVERKGIGNVIEALPAVPGADLVIAGGPPACELDGDTEARRLRELAARHGVGGCVDIRGQLARPDVARLLRSADVVACAPWYEPFGIVALEAMACGVPVVASAVGGLVDTVVDGATGVLVPPRQPRRLATALSWLLEHPEVRTGMGQAGVRRVRSRYRWSNVAAATERVYESVLNREAVTASGPAMRGRS